MSDQDANQQFDAAALAAAALAGALAVFIEPGPYDWMSGVIGITLLSVIFAYEKDRSRTGCQSCAYAMVVAFVMLLVAGLFLELLLGNGSLGGICNNTGGCKSDEFDSHVESWHLASMWGVCTILVYCLDRRRLKQENLAAQPSAAPERS